MNQKKSEIRKQFIKIRGNIPLIRKAIAQKKTLKIAKMNFSKILSFASKPNEVNLWQLNEILAKQNRLCLPKVDKEDLLIYDVKSLKDLTLGKFNILEPDPGKCSLLDIKKISCVLVPGLAFDQNNNRLGFGRGFYDRFLKKLNCPFIGVGYIEQHCKISIPKEKHDIKLNHLLLF